MMNRPRHSDPIIAAKIDELQRKIDANPKAKKEYELLKQQEAKAIELQNKIDRKNEEFYRQLNARADVEEAMKDPLHVKVILKRMERIWKYNDILARGNYKDCDLYPLDLETYET